MIGARSLCPFCILNDFFSFSDSVCRKELALSSTIYPLGVCLVCLWTRNLMFLLRVNLDKVLVWFAILAKKWYVVKLLIFRRVATRSRPHEFVSVVEVAPQVLRSDVALCKSTQITFIIVSIIALSCASLLKVNEINPLLRLRHGFIQFIVVTLAIKEISDWNDFLFSKYAKASRPTQRTVSTSFNFTWLRSGQGLPDLFALSWMRCFCSWH